LIILIIFGVVCKLSSSSLCNFLGLPGYLRHTRFKVYTTQLFESRQWNFVFRLWGCLSIARSPRPRLRKLGQARIKRWKPEINRYNI
jgi:hypothetical protein